MAGRRAVLSPAAIAARRGERKQQRIQQAQEGTRLFNDRLSKATICYYIATIAQIDGSVMLRVQRKVGVKRMYQKIKAVGWSEDSTLTVIELGSGIVCSVRPRFGQAPPGFELLKVIYKDNYIGSEMHKDDDDQTVLWRRFKIVDGWHRAGALRMLYAEERVIHFKLRVVDGEMVEIIAVAAMLNNIGETINTSTFLDFVTGVSSLKIQFETWRGQRNAEVESTGRGKIIKTSAKAFSDFVFNVLGMVCWTRKTIEVYYSVAIGLKPEVIEYMKQHCGGTEEVCLCFHAH